MPPLQSLMREARTRRRMKSYASLDGICRYRNRYRNRILRTDTTDCDGDGDCDPDTDRNVFGFLLLFSKQSFMRRSTPKRMKSTTLVRSALECGGMPPHSKGSAYFRSRWMRRRPRCFTK